MTPGRPGLSAAINITPLIDIVLVLLIVFIVLVPGFTRALPVTVPRIVDAPSGGPRPEVLVVTLDAAGKVFLQREELSLPELSGRLAPAVQLQPLGQRKVFFKVDGDQAHQRVVGVLDQIRMASLRACRETRLRPGLGAEDGGEIKVAVALLNRGSALRHEAP